ncbi:hypothetical protein M3M33_17135, partial [Loigolactobacillus coryniformis]|uniref:hypothetical protein n=1 Tax=Loigolactobacillus coryniformis TaxID=1610 RepID=UPI00201B198C
ASGFLFIIGGLLMNRAHSQENCFLSALLRMTFLILLRPVIASSELPYVAWALITIAIIIIASHN